MEPSRPRRCWLLARVSTDKRSQDGSNARQLETLREYARRQGWEVVGEGEERISGSKGEADRPRLAEALAAARSMRVDTLVVTKLDRLGRSVEHVLAVTRELEALRCGLVVAEMASLSWTDTQTPHGRFLLQVFAALAELYRADYADRSARAIAARRAKGLPLGRAASKNKRWFPPVVLAFAERLRYAGATWGVLAATVARDHGEQYRFPVSAWRRALAKPGRKSPPVDAAATDKDGAE
jgi:DNA invertase Pin-like site-specific DNA recombinase